MVRSNVLLSLFAAAAAVVAKPNQAKNHNKPVQSRNIPGAYIVEFHEGADATEVHEAYAEHAVKRRDFNFSLFKGTSIHYRDVDKAEERIEAMSRLSAVKSVFSVSEVGPPTDDIIWRGNPGREYMGHNNNEKREVDPEDVDDFAPHLMTQADWLRDHGYTGEGISVAIIDTGIDYLHPALGGCIGKDCLITIGHNFVPEGDQEEDDPMDCDGHGTHVAGTVAAQSNPLGFEGAAPGVTLGAYKVFGCNGGASTDNLIAAFNMAYDDGFDIISASIGSPTGWKNEPWAVAVTRIVEKGVPCVLAAGNEGDEGIFYPGSPGAGAISVASFDSTEIPELLTESFYSVNGDPEVEFGWHEGSPAAWEDVTMPLYALSDDIEIEDDACDPLPDDTPDLSEYIVLIRAGTCSYYDKAEHAAEHGAKHILIYNNDIGVHDTSADENDVDAIGMVTAEQGEAWVEALNDGAEIVLSMVDPLEADLVLQNVNNTESGGFASTFTTWGPRWDGAMNPQFAAPGGKILSTLPRAKGSFGVLSGTSMATPLVAAALALIAEARGVLDPSELTRLLAQTAKPSNFHDGSSESDFLAPVAQQGSGLVQIYDAVYADILLSVSGISFNDTDYFTAEQTFKIQNLGDHDITFELSNRPAAMAYMFQSTQLTADSFPNEMTEDAAELKFSDTEVTVPAGEEVEITVTATPPEDIDHERLPVWSGYIRFEGDDGSVYHLAYQGIGGSLRDAPTLYDAASETWDDGMSTWMDANETFILPAPGTVNLNVDHLPGIWFALTTGSEIVHVDIVPVGDSADPDLVYEFLGTETLGGTYFSPIEFYSRDTNWGYDFRWDGELDDGSWAPAGHYRFSVKALHIFGDAEDPDSYDEKFSVPFSIRYEEAQAVSKRTAAETATRGAKRHARLRRKY